MKTREQLRSAANEAMINAVLRHVEDCIKSLRPDTSAITPGQVTGFEAGFRACKRSLLEMLED